MGLLRFILAAAVIQGHSTHIPLLGLLSSMVSVNIFFIISGFYMAMILDAKYQNRYTLFITNRWLRLAPTYYIVLILSVGLYLLVALYNGHAHDRLAYWLSAWNHHHWSALSLTCLVQLTIIGINIPCLLFYSPDVGLTFFSSEDAIHAWRFIFVPQAWSISLEFVFYLIVPFLVRFKDRWLFTLIVVSAALNLILRIKIYSGNSGPWNYQFFLPQMYLFIMGIVAYRHGKWWTERLKLHLQISLSAIFLFFLLWGNISDRVEIEWPLYLTAVICIPCLFELTSSISWDRILGNISYPMYITHILVSWPLHGLKGVHGERVNGVALLTLSIMVSIAIYKWVEIPVDRWRQLRIAKNIMKSK